MADLPDYLIYRKRTKSSRIEVRKVSGEVGLEVTSINDYEFPREIGAEAFLNRRDAINLINALEMFFNISEGDK
jgi:hypothetical protein